MQTIQKFIQYVSRLDGDEKGEAQVFCDRLFQAFGHEGYKEAGASLEFRVKGKKSTRFADLLWGDRVIIEMKKRGSKLDSHRSQVFDYWWKLRPNQPQYCILCNFDEFWIYDFSKQDEPLDKIKLVNLEKRHSALNFLFPIPKEPIFENNLVEVTRDAADKVAKVFFALVERGEDRQRSQRFILQCVFAMFAEDYELLPEGFFTNLLNECLNNGESSYDLIGGLFQQMANPKAARGGRYKDIAYFNGGLFTNPDPIELNKKELYDLLQASKAYWGKVHPAIFGTIFQSSMDEGKRHIFGAHFTDELDIYKIVHPTIIQPWRTRINKADSLTELLQLRKEITEYQVLDPACGSGNFLYIAYRELKRLEMDILNKIHLEYPKSAKKVGIMSLVSPKQFHGIDLNPFAVELAKVTLMLAKEIAIKETRNWIDTQQTELALELEKALPLDNLDNNIICADALFTKWHEADVIIGNPPYQSKNKMQEEFGGEYLNKLWNAYPEISGHADFCVYWFYKAHKVMKEGAYAGLVGTNTIRQNYSREGGLDYIVNNNGTIFNAVSSQSWSGDAAVSVSIVCWNKGEYEDKKLLYIEGEKGKMNGIELEYINSSLSVKTDVTKAKVLKVNKNPKSVFQGQTHGHNGFLLSSNKAIELLSKEKKASEVMKPFLNGNEFVSNFQSQPKRFVIDFTQKDQFEAASYKIPYTVVSQRVLPDRKKKAEAQALKNKTLLEKNPKAKTNKHHINFYNKWWQISYGRKDMLQSITDFKRYIVCSRISLRPIFDFVSTTINPNDALMVFAFEDDFTFGIIQSKLHWEWWKAKCSTLEGRYRYTTNTVWDTFPFPQNPTLSQIKKVAKAAKTLREKRTAIMQKYQYSLRDLYRIVEQDGSNPIKTLHQQLDNAVMEAYGFDKRKDVLSQLLELNFNVADKELKGEQVQAPGLPDWVENKAEFVSEDCVKFLG
ncbi:MAG: DNA methyltransferase [Chitinophagales bacterium]